MEFWTELTDISSLSAWIQSLGSWGVILSALLMVVCALTVLPAEVSAIANGMVYGAFWGALLTWVSALIGSNIAFGLSRTLGPSFFAKLATPETLDRLQAWTRDNGAWALLAAHCIPVVPFFAVNYAAGLSGMGWRTYNLVTAVGILPAILLLTFIGERALQLHWSIWIAIALSFVVASWLLKRALTANSNENEIAVEGFLTPVAVGTFANFNLEANLEKKL